MSASELTEEDVVRRSAVIGAKYALTKEVIYRGLASTVFLAIERATLLQVALKVLMKSKFDSEQERRNAMLEVEIHASLPPHSNVTRLLASEDTPDAFLLATPYTPHGDLWDLTRYGQTYKESEVRNCASQFYAALTHIHSVCGLVHGDIKPHNFLLYRIQKRYCVQLCDFGLVVRPDRPDGLVTAHGIRGTSGWFAPEMIAQRDYGSAMDLFGCGLILFRMLGGYHPFDPPSRFTEVVEFDERCWCHVGPMCKHLLSQVLALEPASRGTAAQICEHEWLTTPDLPEPTPEQLEALSAFGPPPNAEVEFWPAGCVPDPHMRNSYADLQALIKDTSMDLDSMDGDDGMST